jgi:hypothetical protein
MHQACADDEPLGPVVVVPGVLSLAISRLRPDRKTVTNGFENISSEIDSFELIERVHRFHEDTSREIWKRYAMTRLEQAVASAVVAGVLRREEGTRPLYIVMRAAPRTPAARAAFDRPTVDRAFPTSLGIY